MSTPTQGTHFYVMTLDKFGRMSGTVSGTFTPPPGDTRRDVYNDLYANLISEKPDLRGAVVVFFSVEPNQL